MVNHRSALTRRWAAFLLPIYAQVHLFHLQTNSYSQHEATNDLLKNLRKHVDEFLEVFSGKFGRPSSFPSATSYPLKTYSSKRSFRNYLQHLIDELKAMEGTLPSKNDDDKHSEILNLRDELVADLFHAMYLLEFYT